MTATLDLAAARALCEAAEKDWGDESECPGCGATMHLASPELERRGLCVDCHEKLTDLLPQLLAAVEQLQRERDEARAGESLALDAIKKWESMYGDERQRTANAIADWMDTFGGERDSRIAAGIRSGKWKP